MSVRLFLLSSFSGFVRSFVCLLVVCLFSFGLLCLASLLASVPFYNLLKTKF